MPRRLATATICPATSRTWPTEPGAPRQLGGGDRLHGVDHADLGTLGFERGEDGVEVGLGDHRDLQRGSRPAARPAGGPARPTPRRRRTACAARPPARLPSAMFVSVDLPIPGAPPSRTSDPGTMPPPSTRSSSPMPVLMRATGGEPTSRSRRGVSVRGAPPPGAAAVAPAPRPRPEAPPPPRPAAPRRDALLDERVPRLAAGALPQPLSSLKAALRADLDSSTSHVRGSLRIAGDG